MLNKGLSPKEYWNRYKTNPYCKCGTIMIRNDEGNWFCQDRDCKEK